MIMPMAGLGKRFSDAGYELPKPIIEVSGKPMFLQAAYDQPSRTGSVFVVRNDMPGVDLVVSTIKPISQMQLSAASIGNRRAGLHSQIRS